jgi:hypothetical protein
MSPSAMIGLARLAKLCAAIGVMLVAVLSLGAASSRAVSETDWLGRVNEVRQGSQLPPVSDNSAWSGGIAAHLRYLGLTPPSYLTGEYADAHTENPASPYYSEDGDKEARRSDLAFGSSSNLNAIDEWLAAPFHAIGMLRPSLQQVAFARESPSGRAGLDVISGLAPPGAPQLVLFPGPGSTIDLARFGGESPTPIETCEAQHPGADYSSAGLPLIALLTEPAAPGTLATMTQPDGIQVASSQNELCLVTASNFTTSDGIYGPTAREILEADNAVLVIPRRPLTAGTYAVDIAQPSRADIAWSFVSNPPPEPVRLGRKRLRVRFGRPSHRGHYVRVTLDNTRGSARAPCLIASSAGLRRTVLVPVGAVRSPKVRLRRHGRTRVIVKLNGDILASRIYFAPPSRRGHG